MVVGIIAYTIVSAVLDLNNEKIFSRDVEKYLKETDGSG